MTYLHCQCGSTEWTATVQFEVGFTVPTLRVATVTAMSLEHPEREPKCAECGAPRPSFDDLMARKAADSKRDPGLPAVSAL